VAAQHSGRGLLAPCVRFWQQLRIEVVLSVGSDKEAIGLDGRDIAVASVRAIVDLPDPGKPRTRYKTFTA
jgi:hypothetical protein